MFILSFFTFFLIFIGTLFIFRKQIKKYFVEWLAYELQIYYKARRPKRIILVRHGLSEANGNYDILQAIPDNKIHLNKAGIEDARRAGKKIKEVVKNESIKFYVSPYQRTKETYENVLKELKDNKHTTEYHVCLREQEYGNLQADMDAQFEKQKKVGVLYYRFRDGQSGIDVAINTAIFLSDLFREYYSLHYELYDNAVLVTHSLTIEFFILNFFKLPLEEYDKFKLPSNGDIYVLEKNENGRYRLLNDIYKPEYKDEYKKLRLD